MFSYILFIVNLDIIRDLTITKNYYYSM